jgi:hypothetical protein
VPYLQFGGGGNILSGIPKTTSRFNGDAVCDKGNKKNCPSQGGIPFLKIFRKHAFLYLRVGANLLIKIDMGLNF